MNHVLETRYRGANLALEIETPPAITLRINGLVRDTARAGGGPITLRVTSTVQTDYEWHEFIEGVVTWSGGEITARIVANNQQVAEASYPYRETA